MTTPTQQLGATEQHQKWTTEGFGLDGVYFGQKTGGEVTADPGKTKDGGSYDDVILPARPTTSNIVLTKLYRPDRLAAHVKRLEPLCGSLFGNVTGYDTDPDLGVLTDSGRTYGALLVRVKSPDHNINSTDPAMLELEFMVQAAS
jgi:hypothetical protein